MGVLSYRFGICLKGEGEALLSLFDTGESSCIESEQDDWHDELVDDLLLSLFR